MINKTKIEQLIVSCKKQEWAAQKELYLLFADEMMSVAIRYSNDLSSAKDLVQETFLIFFNKIDQFDIERGSLGAWLRKILINKSFAYYRKNRRVVFHGDNEIKDRVSDDTSVIEALEAEDILKLLQKLPKGCRLIFNLKIVEGYNHNEIADMLGITAGASRSQLSRAKNLLRDMINKNDQLGQFVKQSYKANQAQALEDKN